MVRMKVATERRVDLANVTCTYCSAPPTKAIKTPKGGAITVCDDHVAIGRKRVAQTSGPIKKNVNEPHDLFTATKSCSSCDEPAVKGVMGANSKTVVLACAAHVGKLSTMVTLRDKAPAKLVDLSSSYASRLIDLAMTKDGRKSYKNQGKWKHGFIPVDAKAKESKAKGSPIAMKRINRLYGSSGKSNKPIRVKAAERGATENVTTGRVATARRPFLADPNKKKPVNTAGKYHMEVSRGGGSSARAVKNWNEIPEQFKTTRNGVRYVMSVYKGKPQLVRWVGPKSEVRTSDADRRVMSSIRVQDANKLTTTQIRKLLKTPNQSEAAKKVLNKVLAEKTAKAKTRVKRF